MGALKDRAKAMSKFLILDKGESAVVQYYGWKGAADPRDPTKEVTIYEFRENGIQKFWTNSSSKVMLALDHAAIGEWVRVTKNKAINKAGVEDPDKSNYVVEVLGDKPPEMAPMPAGAAIGAPRATGTQINGNPGGVTEPEEIPDPFGG